MLDSKFWENLWKQKLRKKLRKAPAEVGSFFSRGNLLLKFDKDFWICYKKIEP